MMRPRAGHRNPGAPFGAASAGGVTTGDARWMLAAAGGPDEANFAGGRAGPGGWVSATGFDCATRGESGCVRLGLKVGVLTGMVSRVPTFSGVSGVRPLARATSRGLTL